MARKKKENGEQKAPGIGHNVTALTDDQLAALTFDWKKRYETALGTLKKAQADLKNVAKGARADLGKNAIDDIKDMIVLATPEGEAAIKAEIERKARVARWMGLPFGAQQDMFGGVDRTPAVDLAKAQGKRDGLAGDPCKPAYAQETEQYRSYMEGFHEGQAVLAKGIRPFASEAVDSLAEQPTVQ